MDPGLRKLHWIANDVKGTGLLLVKLSFDRVQWILRLFRHVSLESPRTITRNAFRNLAVVGRLAIGKLVVATEAYRLAHGLNDGGSRLPYKDLVRLQL